MPLICGSSYSPPQKVRSHLPTPPSMRTPTRSVPPAKAGVAGGFGPDFEPPPVHADATKASVAIVPDTMRLFTVSGPRLEGDLVQGRQVRELVVGVPHDPARDDLDVGVALVRDPRNDVLHEVLIQVRPAPQLRFAQLDKACVDPVVDAGNVRDLVPPAPKLLGRRADERVVARRPAADAGPGEQGDEVIGGVEVVLPPGDGE